MPALDFRNAIQPVLMVESFDQRDELMESKTVDAGVVRGLWVIGVICACVGAYPARAEPQPGAWSPGSNFVQLNVAAVASTLVDQHRI